jgi:effector-binding domain-containing protein
MATTRIMRDGVSYDVQVERAEATPLAVVRRQVGLSELASVVPECCGLVWEAVKAQKVPAGRLVAIYWDRSIRLEVGVELRGAFVDDVDVVGSATPAGTVASVTHRGSYGSLGAAHDAIRSWCAANGRRLAGPSWEIYGHWRPEWDADPSQIQTDVCYLLTE